MRIILKTILLNLLIVGCISNHEYNIVPKYSIFETWLQHSEQYENPYTEVNAYAEFRSPDGRTTKIPLFWNGGNQWGLRFAPDVEGEWQWNVKSSDNGLNGISGEFTCTNAETHGGVKVWKEHPYHFIYQDSTPYWLFGETQWALTNTSAPNMPLEGEGCNTKTVKQYIDTRAEQGYNLVNIKLLAFGVNEGGDAFFRETVFDSIKKERINPEFWKVADERLQYLHEKGITGLLYLAWFRDNNDGGSLVRWAEFPNEEARLRYARYVIARYSAYNVALVIGGEWKPERPPVIDGDSKKPAMNIVKEVTEWDPHDRMIAVHGGGKGYHHKVFANEPEIDVADCQQVYKKRDQRIREARQYNKPVINAEYGYYLRKFHSGLGNVGGMRHITWQIAMSGGYFVTGWGSTYFGGFRHHTSFGTEANPRNVEWEEQAIHVKNFFNSINWWEYEPVDSVVLTERGISYCLSNKKEYLIYIIDENWKFNVLLNDDVEKNYRVHLFNPRTGKQHFYGEFLAKDTLELISPDRNDWVFKVITK